MVPQMGWPLLFSYFLLYLLQYFFCLPQDESESDTRYQCICLALWEGLSPVTSSGEEESNPCGFVASDSISDCFHIFLLSKYIPMEENLDASASHLHVSHILLVFWLIGMRWVGAFTTRILNTAGTRANEICMHPDLNTNSGLKSGNMVEWSQMWDSTDTAFSFSPYWMLRQFVLLTYHFCQEIWIQTPLSAVHANHCGVICMKTRPKLRPQIFQGEKKKKKCCISGN